jgi:hypothetical protein
MLRRSVAARSCAWVVAGDELGDPREFALGELLARLELLQLGADFAVVEPGEHVALGDLPALAMAHLDDPVADHARDLGPADRLDGTGRIDDLGGGAARCHRHLDFGDAYEAPPGADRQNQDGRDQPQPQPATLHAFLPRHALLPKSAGPRRAGLIRCRVASSFAPLYHRAANLPQGATISARTIPPPCSDPVRHPT